MNADENIKQKVESTFNIIVAIRKVKVDPFFKDRTMQRIFVEKEENNVVWTWFTPKLQFATLVCIIILNVFVFIKSGLNTYEDNVDNFAEVYGLSSKSDTEISIFN